MAYLNICGFETGDANEMRGTSGTVSVQGTTKRTGSYALRANPTTTGTGIGIVSGLAADGTAALFSVTSFYGTCYFNIGTLPGSASEEAFAFPDTGSTSDYFLRVRSDGKLEFFNGTSSIAAGTTVLSTGVWYRIEWKLLISAGVNFTYEFKINGTVELSGTVTDTTITAWTEVWLGKTFNRNSQSVDFYYDDVALSDSAYPDAGQVNILKANGTPFSAWNEGTSTGVNSYQAVDEVSHDSDTTYVKESTTTGAETWFSMEDASTGGVSGTIGSVKGVHIVRDETGASDFQAGMDIGSSGVYTSSVDPGSTYVPICQLRDTDPGGGAWSSTDIDNLKLRIVRNSGTLRVTALYAMVWSAGTTPAELVLASTDGVATATLSPLVTKPLLALSAADGVATAALSPLNSPTYLALGQIDGVAALTMALVDSNIIPDVVSGIATAALEIADRFVFPDPTSGVATASLSPLVTAPHLVLSASDGVATTTLTLSAATLLELAASAGIATATLDLTVLVVVLAAYLERSLNALYPEREIQVLVPAHIVNVLQANRSVEVLL